MQRRGALEAVVTHAGAILSLTPVLAVIACFACASPRLFRAEAPPSAAEPAPKSSNASDPSSIIGDRAAIVWASQTGSPRWGSDDPRRLPGCVGYERPLARVAAAIAAARARGSEASDMKEVELLLRSMGSPLVWPRVWMLEGQALDEEHLLGEWERWVSLEQSVGQRRCGIARGSAGAGREVVVAVVVDALADLAPLPLRARVGQWLRLDARLLAAARAGRLVLMGPDQSPRSVPSTLDGVALHSAFSLDQPGFWRLQVLLDVGSGPQPALEAWVFVDAEPDLEVASSVAPGESAAPPRDSNPDQLRAALWSMIDGVRRSQGLPSLRRDDRLDRVAQTHVASMLSSGKTAHDAGDGLPIERVARAGLVARRVGENVARARSLERAHQVLWDSPSHRGNLIDARYEAVGIGVARTGAGDILVCELFAEYGAGTPPPGPAASLPQGASTGAASRSSSWIWSRSSARRIE
jgi:hypothetical protein